MNSNNHDMNEEHLAGLLSSIERDAPPPDRAVLEALRERSTSVFQTETPPSPGKKKMKLSNYRWLISIAALLILGVVFAQWIIKVNKPLPIVQVPEDKFVLQNKLTDDGRIGKVTDAQGVVSIKPVLAERWSPVTPQLVLKPGDWIRTDSRGANATSLKLGTSTSLIVGPHSTVELVKPSEIRLIAGELEITASKESPVELLGPNKTSMKIEGKQFIRIEKEKLVRVAEEPRWLKGFKGTTTNESIGSLIATVDGRDTPLTVGYHHVTVDIRDQIARTVIEESFVNRTGAVLEGIFYFPLPQDASISGFGMWIGDQLVEADVVEKQRAREIYETILREKRDPGLLEWAGGNIFKARVFPIPAMSEKRIKISYTQVLPMKGNKYRYSYGLQSEMLKQFPLKDLKIDVKINSAVNLKSVTSPTHDTRLSQTEHSGHVEFSAQEYTPTRDFEAVIEVAGRTSDVVVIPHRRGEDGYFLVQLTPPDGLGNWDRPLIPNGEPLKLLVLADTSASMDRGQRNTQNALLASLLSSLTPKDQINVAACDVNCDWIFEKPMPATPENVAKIRDVLAKRVSLGWTNLDKAITSAMAMSSPDTHTIYLGDGIVTTGDADPVAFAKRLAKVYEPKSGIFHAITLGSSYEPAAVKAIAAMGGGSWRRVSGEQSPQVLVTELLSEIATPALRNIKVEITGVRTARVYPEELPNVAAGSQQILLGRYLPEGKDQQGEIIVTGMLGSKPVRYTTKFSLKDAELGNSFIPRLWARMHLDKLLSEGTSEAIKQDIIALSEEFNIITPYTSLLVLESDADRERFAVKRRFQMRDGEKFFAQGRDNAMFDLKQKQMKQAGDYRTALRRKILAQLVNLGRDTRMFQNPIPRDRLPVEVLGRAGYNFNSTSSGGWGGELGYLGDESELRQSGFNTNGRYIQGVDNYFGVEGTYKDAAKSLDDSPREISPNEPASPAMPALTVSPSPEQYYSQDMAIEKLAKAISDNEYDGLDDRKALGGKLGYGSYGNGLDAIDMDGTVMLGGISDPYGRTNFAFDGEYQYSSRGRFERLGESIYEPNPYMLTPRLWLSMYPGLNAPARDWKEPKSKWSPEAIALSRSLVRKDKLAQVKGGITIVRTTEYYNARQNELGSRSQRYEYVSPSAWLVRINPDSGPITISWCDARERGNINTAFQLGRVRASNKFDLAQPPLEMPDHSVMPIHISMARDTATVEAIAKDRVLLILKNRNSPDYETRYLIDTNRHVILSVEARSKGKVISSSKYDDFVEIAGSWWAHKVESFDEKNVRITSITQTVTAVSAEDHAKSMTQELAGKAKVLFLKQPLPTITEAKAAIAAGKATFDDRTVMVLHFAMSQQWTRVTEHVTECERLAGDKPGMRWLSDSFLMASRKHAEMSKRYSAYAGQLVNAKDPNEYYLAAYILGQAQQVMEANEILAFSDTLKPIYERQPKHIQAEKSWRVTRVSLYQQVGQQAKALELSKQLAVDYPQEYWQQYQYAQNLVGTGDYDAAYAWLNRVLVPEAKWPPSEADALRSLYTQFLQTQGRYTDLAEYLADWIKLNPEGDSAYSQYLFALIRSNQGKKAEELAAQWLREAKIAGELPRSTVAKLQTAVSFAMGQNQYIYSYRVEERWNEPLAQVALFFARHPELNHVSSRILNHHSDANSKVRKTIIDMLMKEYQSLSLADFDRLVMLVWNEISIDDLKKLSADLRKKWDAEKDADKRHEIGQKLLRNLERISIDDYLAFQREQWKQATPDYRVLYANRLFNTLISHTWKAENEDEAFALLEQLADPDELAKGLYTQVANLHRLTDAMASQRYQALMNKIENAEKLSRPDYQKKQAELLKLAREGYAENLRQQVAMRAKPLAPWLTIERLRFEILLERNLKQIADDCWAFLKTEPVKANPDDDDTQVTSRLDDLLRNRYRITLTNLATRKNADAELITKLLKYIDDQLAAKPDSDQWRSEKYRLLIALDRSKDIETELKRWINLPNPNAWKLALGSLYAELGQLPNAIKMYEDVELADELTPAAYRSLADWYLVENRREQYEKAQATVYKTTSENYLAQRINVYLRPWQSNHLPTQLDKEVLQVFQVLFQKSAWPQNYLWHLQQFYQASRDFRLLSMLPEAVIGHTPGKVYPFLTAMHIVLNEIRDEATADEIIAQIVKTRTLTKSVVDLRALDLLEMLVERRAAELHNQPGPHTKKATAALDRVIVNMSKEEPRLMADLLHGLGKITQPALNEQRLEIFILLRRLTRNGTIDHLHITQRYAEILHADSKNEQAMDLLQAGLKEFEEANNGILPNSANGALGWYVSITESAKQFERGEKFLLAQLKHPVHTEQKYFLTQRLQQHYLEALRNGGEVSLGKGAALYKVLEKRLMEGLKTTDANHRYQVFTQLTRLYYVANDLKFEGVVKDLQTYAFEFVPALLKAQSTHYDELVRDLGNTLRTVAGPLDGIRFLLDCAENAPDWQRYTNQDVWQLYNNSLGQWKFETKDLGDQEPRLLKFILTELRRDLRTQQRQFRTFYARHHNWFWTEKAGEFAKVAEEIYAEKKASGSAVEYIATYMFDGLPMEKRAIEILYIAHKEKILSDNGQWLLAVYLQRQERYAESIPILIPLMERGPDNLSYRRKLMHAYFKTDKKVELLDLLKKTDAYFHEKDRWNEHVLAELAASTLENQLFAESAKYYDELIPLHQKTHARRGIGNGTLSAYYASASQAYTGLGKTKEAVDMASGAVVSWGPHQQQRKDALNALVNVLASAKDLKAYITELDKEKLQSAVVRKAIGQAYIQKNEHALAIPQLQFAAELQPNDTETYTLLLTCCDKIGDKEKAIEQLYQAVELSRRDIKLYEELGKRLNDNQQTVEGERANTSIVEMLPNESESHSALAEIREKQNRWPEAIAHWERVANIRLLEPTGLLKLAAAQIHEKDWKNAAESLRKLRTKTWPQRFTDVEKQTRELELQLEKSQN